MSLRFHLNILPKVKKFQKISHLREFAINEKSSHMITKAYLAFKWLLSHISRKFYCYKQNYCLTYLFGEADYFKRGDS